MSKNKQYAKFLRGLAANGPAEFTSIFHCYQSVGACSPFFRQFNIRLKYLLPYHVYTGWPHFSGDRDYPVPDPEFNNCAEDMYNRTVHKWEGEYGKLRRDWCLHLAKYFEELDND